MADIDWNRLKELWIESHDKTFSIKGEAHAAFYMALTKAFPYILRLVGEEIPKGMAPPDIPPANKRSCNIHSDCDAADAKALVNEMGKILETPAGEGIDATARRLMKERAAHRRVLLMMAEHWLCERWAPHTFGEDPQFVGCMVYNSDDPEEYCLGCEAQAVLLGLKD